MTEDVWPVHDHALSLLAIAGAESVLDPGCGRGEHLQRLAASASGPARFVGVDSSAKSIDSARAATAYDSRFEFVVHDVTQGLPFSDATFDRVISINTLEVIPDKVALLRQAHRVLKPNGRVVVGHFDWDSQLYDGLDRARVRRIVHAFADWKQSWMADADAWMGRRLWRVLQESGLFSGRIEARVHTSTTYADGCYGWERARDIGSMVKRGMISAEDYEAFRMTVERLAAEDKYCYAITMFNFVGEKIDSKRDA